MRYHFFRLLALLTVLSFAAPLSAQYITTIAGNGVSACYTNNQPALCTPFSYPQSVCAALNGDLYITCGNSIKMVTASTGIVTAVAGSDTYGSTGDGGLAINATFEFTRSVRMDKSGNLYIAEYGGHRIRKITASTGIITTIAGNGIAGYSGDGGAAVNASINQPNDIAVDGSGNVFIADFLNNRIRKVDAATGNISTFAGTGVASSSGDGGQAASSGIPYPNSICLDNKGNLYISESYSGNSCRIRKVDAVTGIITTIAGNNAYAYGGDGGPAVNASLLDPSGVIADNAGNIYIAEYDDSRIRKVDATTGIINTIAGTGVSSFTGDGGLAINATLNDPVGLFADNTGNLFVCDNQNLRVRKIYLNATTLPVNTPQINISASSTSVCSSDPIIFTATITNAGSNPSYQWQKNGATVGIDSPAFAGIGLQGGDVVTCTLYYTLCSVTSTVVSNSITLTGGSAGPVSLSISASDTAICQNQNVTFIADATNAGSNPAYQWKLNGVNVGTNDTVYTNENLNNGDVISCMLTAAPALPCSNGGTAVSNNIIMKVSTSSSPAVSIIASDNNICPGTKLSFSATVQNAGSSPAYQWKLNGSDVGSNSDSFSDSTLANNDSIFCIITSNADCAGLISSNTVVVSVKRIPSIMLYPSDTTVNKGSQVQLQAIVNGAVSSYAWYPLNALTNAAGLSPVTVPLLDNSVFVFSIITTDNCTDSVTAFIKVQQKLFMPNAFTPNRDGKNDVFRIPPNTSLNLKDFTIYNRWGGVVFMTTDVSTGWDGTYKNLMQDAGTYIYVIRGTDTNGPVFVKGWFVLVR
jgi:gliding motility-associated-like protein